MPKADQKKVILPVKASPVFDLDEATQEVSKWLGLGDVSLFDPIPTGMPLIDEALGGGYFPEDLYILAGPQNVGKTAAALQQAKHISQHALAIYVCYEHTVVAMWERLLCQASGDAQGEDIDEEKIEELVTIADIRKAYKEIVQGAAGSGGKYIDQLLEALPNGVKVWQSMTADWKNMWLIQGDGIYTDPETLEAYVEMAKALGHNRIVLFVDYAQRVPVPPQQGIWLDDLQRIDMALRALKSMAMNHRIAVVAVGAADPEGLRLGRIHLENLWGGAVMQYEPDGAIILNRDTTVKDGRVWVRWALEKNRHGPANLEWQHLFLGQVYSFAKVGISVPEEENWQAERMDLRKRYALTENRTLDPGVDYWSVMLGVLQGVFGTDEMNSTAIAGVLDQIQQQQVGAYSLTLSCPKAHLAQAQELRPLLSHLLSGIAKVSATVYFS
jgi:replicative DNA helicase